MNQTAHPGLVPPCPNLGPEPWSEPQSTWLVFVAVPVSLLIGVVLAFAWVMWRRRRSARRAGQKRLPILGPDATPRERLIGLSGSLREALVDRFGPSYRARTIEELFADGQLGELLGIDRLEELTHFLVQVDQLKFARQRAPREEQALQVELADWAPRVEKLTTHIRARGAVTGNQKAKLRMRRQAQRA